jgi:hypothetical protein
VKRGFEVWGDTGRVALVPVNTATCKTTHTHTLHLLLATLRAMHSDLLTHRVRTGAGAKRACRRSVPGQQHLQLAASKLKYWVNLKCQSRPPLYRHQSIGHQTHSLGPVAVALPQAWGSGGGRGRCRCASFQAPTINGTASRNPAGSRCLRLGHCSAGCYRRHTAAEQIQAAL